MDYQVVYSILNDSPRVPWFHLVVGIVVPIILIMVALSRQKIRTVLFALVWAFVWNLLIIPSSMMIYSAHQNAAQSLKRGESSVVEGKIEDFHPMPYSGHQEESFTVKGVHFEYSDFDDSRPGFNRTESHGGPLHAGMTVRIHYLDKSILQIEVPRTEVPRTELPKT